MEHDTQNNTIKFVVGEFIFSYSLAEINFNTIKKEFYQLAIEAAHVAENDFPDKFDGLDDFYHRAPQWALELFNRYCPKFCETHW